MTVHRITFNRARLQNLRPPKKGRVYYYDDALRGLALCVLATGAKVFRVYRKVNRRPERITLGTFDPAIPDTRELSEGVKPLDLLGHNPSLNVRMARKLATAVNASLDTGINPSAAQRDARQAQQGLSFGGLFGHYRTNLVREGKKSVASLTWVFERYLGELPDTPRKKHGQQRTKPEGAVNWQHRAVCTILAADVARLRFDLADNVGRTTSNRVMEVVSAMFNFGKKAKPPLYIGENPAADVGKFEPQERQQFVRAHDAAGFVSALESETDLNFKDYIYLSLYIGARRGNMLRMKWSEVSLSERTQDDSIWTVSGELMKGGKTLVVPLVREAVAILRRRAEKAESEWVFPGKTAVGHMGPQRRKWTKLLERAGLTDLHIHDLRRTLGSWMSNTGASTVVTMRALGHRSIDAALIYQQSELNPVRVAMQQGIAGFFQAAKARHPPGRKKTHTQGRESLGKGGSARNGTSSKKAV